MVDETCIPNTVKFFVGYTIVQLYLSAVTATISCVTHLRTSRWIELIFRIWSKIFGSQFNDKKKKYKLEFKILIYFVDFSTVNLRGAVGEHHQQNEPKTPKGSGYPHANYHWVRNKEWRFVVF